MSALNKNKNLKLHKNIVPVVEQEPEQPLTEYNNLTELSYKSKGLLPPANLKWEVKNFLAQYDPSKGPIQKTVSRIVRLKEIDHNSERKERKDFIYWYEQWNAKDWTGSELPSVGDHVEGFYFEQLTTPVIERNRVVGHRRSGERKVYYVPFSKKAVDDVIAKSVGSDKETIIFTVKTDNWRNGDFTYDQFITPDFNDLVKLAMTPGGPKMAASLAEKKVN